MQAGYLYGLNLCILTAKYRLGVSDTICCDSSICNQAVGSLKPYTRRLVHKACTCMLVAAPGLEAFSKQTTLSAKIKSTSQRAAHQRQDVETALLPGRPTESPGVTLTGALSGKHTQRAAWTGLQAACCMKGALQRLLSNSGLTAAPSVHAPIHPVVPLACARSIRKLKFLSPQASI